MNPQNIARIRELVAAGKSRDEIKAEFASSGVGPADLDDMLDILHVTPAAPSAPVVPPPPPAPAPNPIQTSAPPVPAVNPIQPPTPVMPAPPVARQEQYGASGSEMAYVAEEKARGPRTRKRIFEIIAIVVGVIIFAAGGSVVYGLIRVNTNSSSDLATIASLQTQPAAATQAVTTPCFTAAVPSSLAPKASTLCEVTGQQPNPLEVVTIKEQQSANGGKTQEAFAKQFVSSLKQAEFLTALKGGCLMHATLISPTVMRRYSTCATSGGKKPLSAVAYDIFTSTTIVDVLGVSDTMADNPAPGVYASLNVTTP